MAENTSVESVSRENMLSELGLMTEEQTAILLGVTCNTLMTWRREGRGPDFVKPSKEILYYKSDILAWISAQKQVMNRVA